MSKDKFWDGDLMLIPTDEVRKQYDLEIGGNWILKCPDSTDDRVIVNDYGYRTAKAMRIYYTSKDPLWKGVPDEQRRYKFSTRYDKSTDSKKFDQDCVDWYNMKRAKRRFMNMVEDYIFKKSPKEIFNIANKWEVIIKEKEYRDKHPEEFQKDKSEPEEQIQTNLLR